MVGVYAHHALIAVLTSLDCWMSISALSWVCSESSEIVFFKVADEDVGDLALGGVG